MKELSPSNIGCNTLSCKCSVKQIDVKKPPLPPLPPPKRLLSEDVRIGRKGIVRPKYKIFDQDYSDIPLCYFSGDTDLIICHDPQDCLGKTTWAVLECIRENPEIPATIFGLFRDKDTAIRFADIF